MAKEARLPPPEPVARTVYRVREYGMVDLALADLLTDGEWDVDSRATGRYFTFQLKKDQLRLQAGGYIGFIPINDRIAVDVIPRCPITNLARLLRVGGFAPQAIETYARDYGADTSELPNLRDLYARSLLDEIRYIEAYGRLREYRQRVERTQAPRGRLVLGAPETQIAAAGWSPTVRAAWYERTADTAANRCLKMAIWLLGRADARSENLTASRRRLVVGLNNAYALFEDAELDGHLGFLSDPIVVGTVALPTTRSYYRNALDIARLVVRSAALAFDRPGADVQMPSIVIRMDDVFETYVRNVLQDGTRAQPSMTCLDGNKEGAKNFFDTLPSVPANPDIVVRTAGSTAVVLDVKYKPAEKDPDRTDLNQVIAYGMSYRAPAVVIVQPRASGSGRNHLVHLGDIENLRIYQYVLDLQANLEREEAEMVTAIAGLAGATESVNASVAA